MKITILTIITLIPLFFYPSLLNAGVPETEGLVTLIKLYPIVIIVYALCARICRRERPYVSYILIVMSLLTSAAAYSPLFLNLK